MMKLLLDESIARRLTKVFPPQYQCLTVQDMGWAGTKNGALLTLAAEAGFDAFLSADKNLEYQQNPTTIPLPIIVLDSPRTRFAELKELVPAVVQLIESNPTNGVHRVVA